MDMTGFISRLRAQKTTREIFRIPRPLEEVTKMLQEAVRFEVEYRGGTVIEDNMEHIEQAARWLTDPKTPGLYIAGNVGNGKTTLLNAIIQTINVQTNELPRDAKGKNAWVFRINSSRLVEVAKKSDEELGEWIRRPMLAIDDLGSEESTVKTYGNVLNPAVELLSYRYEYQLFTIVTTNLKPDDIRKVYGDRIADRLNEMMTRINIKVPTYRTKNSRKS